MRFPSAARHNLFIKSLSPSSSTRGLLTGWRGWREEDLCSSHHPSSKTLSFRTINDPPKRYFHTSPRQEILPLVAAGAVLFIGRYSYKAVQRMDEEWEDYLWQKQQYEKQTIREHPEKTPVRNIAVDLGSFYTKVALSHPKPEIAVTREGDRAFFSGILYEAANHMRVEKRGRAALEQFFYENDQSPHCLVKLPYTVLSTEEEDSEKMIYDLLGVFMAEAVDRMDLSDKPLRPVVTLPTHMLPIDPHIFQQALPLADKQTVIVPDPVAAIWGAQNQFVLNAMTEDKTLVIDIGGLHTQIAVVEKDKVLHASVLPWGGESFVSVAVDLLQRAAPKPDTLHDARSLAALQTHARNVVIDFSSNTKLSQTSVHVPYLFADPAQHHLDTKLSRSVLEQAINDDIQDNLTGMANELGLLSPHMPLPTDVSYLLVSVITQVLEQSQSMPSSIRHVLLVGGGSRLVQESCQQALYALMGPEASDKLVAPDMRSELTALGGASMLPNYSYSMEDGLYYEDS